ncbi:TetR-like C-terminal domain-containing protein [Mammaliicoccus sciuri]|nr:TetR-like C-terminal domain-containing protein [Mammaliicoccus sciuri]MDT0669243.1 TetR-like C-terminal domain-containing protein [Mammaliicoccus sciuri]
MIFDHLSSYKNINNTIGDIPLLYFTSYVSGAGISLIKHWIQDENRIDKSHLIKHFTTIVNNGPVPLMEKEQFPKYF